MEGGEKRGEYVGYSFGVDGLFVERGEYVGNGFEVNGFLVEEHVAHGGLCGGR